MRFSDSSERLQTVNCSMAMMLNAVGMTQLAEPVTQGQPYLSGSKRTLRSEVLNFHRQNQCPYRPRSAYSHRKAFSQAAAKSPVAFSVHSASAVVQLPSESPRNAGQPPSLSCAFSRNRMAALLFACLSNASASSAKHVASRLSCTESKYAHLARLHLSRPQRFSERRNAIRPETRRHCDPCELHYVRSAAVFGATPGWLWTSEACRLNQLARSRARNRTFASIL